MRRANYDKFPRISVPNSAGACVAGWGAGVERLRQAVAERGARKTTIVVECYPGVDEREVLCQLQAGLRPALALRAEEALLAPREIETLVAPFLGGDDPVFGFLSGLTLPQFFAPARVAALAAKAAAAPEGVTVIVGVGARLVARGDILIYADLPRWEAQKRFRRKEAANLGTSNHGLAANLQYKRAYFVDWRVADRWKRPLLHEWDFVLDTIAPGEPKLAEGEAVRRALDHAVTRPFRVAPFFDPAPWGGQWMREVCDLGAGEANYGWCFDGVPEENSLLLDFDGVILELPALDLVFYRPRALLGEAVHARFGDEFPIRFDFLDTMGGGNLSFQVHPLTEYIQQHFGMHYTQDESYYVLDAGPEAQVYLGLRDGVNRTAMIRDLALAQAGQIPFPVEKYAGAFAARPHDHFLIPAGTPHCAGANAMVLEISATPYIFTFKMWDWGRLGLDGAPRPIHLQHGIANIQWDRTAAWVRRHLVNQIAPVASGDGWTEERTGLDEREFIESRRHWFSKSVAHETGGGVNVLNLVAGEEALVESPDGSFAPFPIHYAETFIVPAAVGSYVIRPAQASGKGRLATVKAYVRTAASSERGEEARGGAAARAPAAPSLLICPA